MMSRHFARLNFSLQPQPVTPQSWGVTQANSSTRSGRWQDPSGLCAVCTHTSALAKCARALLDWAMPALLPACRADGQQKISMRICGEKRQKQIGCLPEDFTLKRIQMNTYNPTSNVDFIFFLFYVCIHLYINVHTGRKDSSCMNKQEKPSVTFTL